MDELQLDRGVPILVTPVGDWAVVQNTMPTNDDDLYVSRHGDVSKKWVAIESENTVTITDAVWFLQKGRSSWVFPVIDDVTSAAKSPVVQPPVTQPVVPLTPAIPIVQPAPAPYAAEFKMANLTDTINVGNAVWPVIGDLEVSLDGGTTWTDAVDGGAYRGSLTIKFRSKPGGAPVTRMSFEGSTIDTVMSVDLGDMTSMESLFSRCKIANPMPMIDTSKITNMNELFFASTVPSVPLWDTSNVESFAQCFSWCYLLASFPGWDTSKGKYMDSMFGKCPMLTCLVSLDTTSALDTGGPLDIFFLSTKLVNPTAAEITKLQDVQNGGFNYVNANQCP